MIHILGLVGQYIFKYICMAAAELIMLTSFAVVFLSLYRRTNKMLLLKQHTIITITWDKSLPSHFFLTIKFVWIIFKFIKWLIFIYFFCLFHILCSFSVYCVYILCIRFLFVHTSLFLFYHLPAPRDLLLTLIQLPGPSQFMWVPTNYD